MSLPNCGDNDCFIEMDGGLRVFGAAVAQVMLQVERVEMHEACSTRFHVFRRGRGLFVNIDVEGEANAWGLRGIR